jgi:hypothetical protein
VNGDDSSYQAYTARKASKLSRPKLDCGCPKDGPVYAHLWCDRLACRDHADDVHDCSAFGGAKSGTEEKPEPVEAAPPVLWVQSDTSPWVSFADVAAGPSTGGIAAVDVRRRVQDGAVPGPDRLADAFRAEVLRQGLSDCEIDGQPWAYRDGRWMPAADAPLLDVVSDPDPVTPRRRVAELYAALKARRTRRGGTT